MIKTIFAVESSCDETAVSIVQAKYDGPEITEVNVRAHLIESQVEIHAPFGGVVPEVAARDHLAKIYDLARQALAQAGMSSTELDAVAVTLGPGLIGALMVGVLFARGFALSLGKPLIGVNHVDAHLAPALLLSSFSPKNDLNQWIPVRQPQFPALSLTVSGGHCHLSYLDGVTNKKILGKSLDDACGEAFDKVAKLLGLGYPGGPRIEQLAREAENNSLKEHFNFPEKISDTSNRYDFSYSGLKTAVMEVVRKKTGNFRGKISGAQLDDLTKQSLAYSFQEAALKQLADRVQNAINDFPQINSVFVAGGVAQNQRFRQLFSQLQRPIYFAPASLCSDNATMIALQAHFLPKYDGFIHHAFPRYQ